MQLRPITEDDIRLWFEHEVEVGTLELSDPCPEISSKVFLYVDGVVDPARLASDINDILAERAE